MVQQAVSNLTQDRQSFSDFSIRKVFVLVLAMVVVALALDQIIFRWLYLWVVEPESTAGTTLLLRNRQAAAYDPGKKNVLILGDSRINEGFSARIANGIAHQKGFNIVALGAPGTTPRVWHYLLRDLDPQANRYHAIYLMAYSLRDDDTFDEWINRPLDTAYAAPLLNWGDLWSYSRSFDDPKQQHKSVLEIIFPAMAFKSDVLGFIQSPRQRIRKAFQWRAGISGWLEGYTGRPESLPAADVPFGRAALLARLSDDSHNRIKDYLRRYGEAQPMSPDRVMAYRYRWFGQIADTYRSGATRLNVFLIPRGPYHAAMNKPAEASGSLRTLESQGYFGLLPPDSALMLEKPEYFFDELHLNEAGRQVFSRTLTEAVLTHLEK